MNTPACRTNTPVDRIIQGDCVEQLAKLQAESVDLVFADPPFNIGYDYDVYDDRKAANDYLEWSRRWIEGVIRVLKPNGTFWLAIGDEFAAELKVLCTRELGLHTRNWVIWFYTFGVHCKHKFTRSHAHLFYFVKNPAKHTFNSLDVRVPSARELVYGDKRADPDGRVPDDTWMMPPILPPDVVTRDGFILRPQDIPERFPPASDTWYYSRVAGTFNERRGWHGCQMPEQLLGRIIRGCSNEGDVVLDPFGGSGTTLAVAKKLCRPFIGIELSKDYVKKINQRLANINPGDPLVGPENAALSAPRTSRGRKLERGTPKMKYRLTKSPVIARSNVSLGQVAVANGEYATAIVEAFMAAHDGYSADRVIADPGLNDRFLENCRILSIPGEPRDWNHLLLNIRKGGGLSAVDTSRRTVETREAMEEYMFASEMAWRKLSKNNANPSLDDILADPDLASQFDSIASGIAPGFNSFQYRWAALSLRKFSAKGRKIKDDISIRLAPVIGKPGESNSLSLAPGHYLISVSGAAFFAGFTNSLRACPLLQADRIHAALECTGGPVGNISIKTQTFDIRRIPNASSAQPLCWQAVRRAKLIGRYGPFANVPVTRLSSTDGSAAA